MRNRPAARKCEEDELTLDSGRVCLKMGYLIRMSDFIYGTDSLRLLSTF